MKPTTPFAKVPDQMRLRGLTLEQSNVPPAGRVMYCRGRRVIKNGHVAELGDFLAIPKDADTIVLAPADFDDVKNWRDGR